MSAKCTLWLLFCASTLVAQTLPIRSLNYRDADFSVDGSPIRSLYQTSDGFLWASHFGQGIFRYEGNGVTRFGPEDGVSLTPITFVEDRRGHLWVGGRPYRGVSGGISYSSRPVTGGVLADDLHFRKQVGGVELAGNDIYDLDIDTAGNIWAIQDTVLDVYRYTGDTTIEVISGLQQFKLPNGHFGGISLIPSPDGGVWIAPARRPMYKVVLPDGGRTIEVVDSFLVDERPENLQLEVQDRRGYYWGILDFNKLARLNPATGEYLVIDVGLQLQSVELLGADRVAVATNSKGLFLYDIETAALQLTIDETEGLPTSSLFATVIDRKGGNIFLGAIDGIYRLPLDYLAYRHYDDNSYGDRPALLSNGSVNVVETDLRIDLPDGSQDTFVLAGLLDGLLVVPQDERKPYTLGVEQGLTKGAFMDIIQDRAGGIYLSLLSGGIAYLRPAGLAPLPGKESTTPVPAFAPGYVVDYTSAPQTFYLFLLPGGERPAGQLWFGRNRQVMYLDDDGSFQSVISEGMGSGQYRYVGLDDAGYLHMIRQRGWIRSRRPLDRIPPPVDTVAEDLFELVAVADSGGQAFVNYEAMGLIDDRLWLISDSTLLIVHPRTAAVERSRILPGGVNATALAEADSVVWVSTARGVVAFDKADLSVRHRLLREQGLLHDDGWSPNGLAVTRSGSVYHGTVDGLQRIKPGLIRPDTAERPVYLTTLDYDADPWGRNELNVRYTMLSYRDDPERLRYRTRLAGYDDEWSDPTTENSLRYTNLSAFLFPKTYEMQVRSTDYLGNTYRTEEGAYPITVRPPLYFRWWAILLYLGLLLLAGRAYARYRLRRQEETNRLRETETIRRQRDEIAAKNAENELLLKEIHHRVKNNLEVVSGLLELHSATLEEGDALEVMRAGQSRVNSMGLLHQKLYRGKDLATVPMQDYLRDLTLSIVTTYDAGESVSVRVAVPHDLRLDVDTAVPIGLIVNELVTNSLKYAFPSDLLGEQTITVAMDEEDQRRVLTVSDNGRGKTGGPARGTGFGTRLVHLLTTQLEGELRERTGRGLTTQVLF